MWLNSETKMGAIMNTLSFLRNIILLPFFFLMTTFYTSAFSNPITSMECEIDNNLYQYNRIGSYGPTILFKGSFTNHQWSKWCAGAEEINKMLLKNGNTKISYEKMQNINLNYLQICDSKLNRKNTDGSETILFRSTVLDWSDKTYTVTMSRDSELTDLLRDYPKEYQCILIESEEQKNLELKEREEILEMEKIQRNYSAWRNENHHQLELERKMNMMAFKIGLCWEHNPPVNLGRHYKFDVILHKGQDSRLKKVEIADKKLFETDVQFAAVAKSTMQAIINCQISIASELPEKLILAFDTRDFFTLN